MFFLSVCCKQKRGEVTGRPTDRESSIRTFPEEFLFYQTKTLKPIALEREYVWVVEKLAFSRFFSLSCWKKRLLTCSFLNLAPVCPLTYQKVYMSLYKSVLQASEVQNNERSGAISLSASNCLSQGKEVMVKKPGVEQTAGSPAVIY